MAKYNCVGALCDAGISYKDATALRRISMTLHRWHELECGDGNDYGSWCITRGYQPSRNEPFKHDDDGFPYMEHHHYTHGHGKDFTSYTRLADKERGGLKRLARIMANYPGWASYVQGDPRGCALYILRPQDFIGTDSDLSSIYNRGIAVCR